MLAVLAGHVWFLKASSASKFDGIFLVVLVIDLLPPIVYAMFIRKRHATLLCGALLTVITSFAWFAAIVNASDGRMLAPILAWLVTMSLSVGMAANEATG